MLKDLIRVADAGTARIRTRAGQVLQRAAWGLLGPEKSVVEVKGWVRAVLRERGKIVRRSEGHNIWTNTGREYLAMLMSMATGPSPGTTFRDDRVAYIGVGTGSQTEDVNVTELVTPVVYDTGLYLAEVDSPPTFPLTPSRTTVQFKRTFAEDEITVTPGSSVDITELGLFTNGDPAAVPAYDPGTIDPALGTFSPVAYKTFTEAMRKTDALELEVTWEIRF